MSRSVPAPPEQSGGLTLTRHPGEGFVLRFDNLEVRIRRGNDDHVVIHAPRQVQVLREELLSRAGAE